MPSGRVLLRTSTNSPAGRLGNSKKPVSLSTCPVVLKGLPWAVPRTLTETLFAGFPLSTKTTLPESAASGSRSWTVRRLLAKSSLMRNSSVRKPWAFTVREREIVGGYREAALFVSQDKLLATRNPGLWHRAPRTGNDHPLNRWRAFHRNTCGRAPGIQAEGGFKEAESMYFTG